MANLLENLNLENLVFRSYAFWSVVLILKMLFMAFLTVIQRVKNKAVASKEDSPKGIVKFSEDVERQRRAHRNDLENIPIFLIIAFLYVLTSPSQFIAVNLIRLFAISRLIHTFVYAIKPMQPARAITFFVGALVTFYMSINVLIFFY
ncbi:hypothetical protein PVAND_011984 [Polypedilum vanderplanki]|uniref:Microsomal glutathione S-transferase 1 n=1 Tax=Polypedilum vanderplanki TaxID=319348 RepID=A0A9J6CL20_POLVA|nr:hypothetical protein PVAND_011984 [Polypedilum vanderplanki]